MTLLSLTSVSVSYARGDRAVPVLRDLSLDVDRGELVAVYGKQASGKTTLLKVAAGLLRPDGGRVAFAGDDLTELPPTDVQRLQGSEIGWVAPRDPEDSEPPTLLHIALPLYGRHGARTARRRAAAALDRVGAAHCADRRRRDLIDTDRALVLIAQALVHEPQLLVVDDPTYGFSVTDRHRVVALLRSIADEDGIGVLMAVPEMAAMLTAHTVHSLHNGRLVGGGQPQADRDNVVRLPRGG